MPLTATFGNPQTRFAKGKRERLFFILESFRNRFFETDEIRQNKYDRQKRNNHFKNDDDFGSDGGGHDLAITEKRKIKYGKIPKFKLGFPKIQMRFDTHKTFGIHLI